MIRKGSTQTALKYRLLTEHSQEIIIFFDQSGNILECNQTANQLLGYDEDIYQTPITDIFRQVIKNVNNRLIINKKHLDCFAETIAYRKNQTCFTVNLRITIKQSRIHYMGAIIAVDLTAKTDTIHELRKIKQELKLSRQTKNEFVANISHELRTPVNGIMGLIENLMETELTPNQLETVNIIHRCCINMNTIINDLLDYTKIANNKLILEQRVFNFRKFINNIIALYINKISEKGLKLLVNVADDIPSRVIGDELRLNQILHNLLSNAIKFTSVGQIAIEVVKTEQTEHEIELFFMIMDTGIGINLEEKDKLFQSFSQVDGSITRRFGGTGLGLSISKMLVEAMHGTINVESEKNMGSIFSFSVRLGYTESMEEMTAVEGSSDILPNDLYINEKVTNKAPVNSSFHEVDYIGKLLEKANFSPLELQKLDTDTGIKNLNNLEYISKDILDIMERLMMCIEIGNWLKAEDFASLIKLRIPDQFKEIKNKALRLVLSVRKEDHDNSILYLNELREMVHEVTRWKM